ncbi:MAG: hypothetical protein SF052_20790 [Bacteroidia bacterium]|nr:hypothetical protein [Bacteroidia bacterium]
MSNSSKKTYSDLLPPNFKEVFAIFDRVCYYLRIEYYLIGAQARNFHLLENGITPGRITEDIDFAVRLPGFPIYDEMQNMLVENGFRKDIEPYRLIHEKTETMIDLLPFGEIEREGTVTFAERKTELSVIGMKEVNAYTIDTELEGLTIKVSPLEGIVILKLISFSEKPGRKKDLDDLSEILRNYFEINQDRFYTAHLDMVDEIESTHFVQLAGARLMGRDMKKILVLSEKLSSQIESTIKNELTEKTGSITQYFLSENIFEDYELIKDIFAQILKGISE